MPVVTVTVPDEMKAWLEKQAAVGRYADASDYVRDLVRRDQERASKIANMQALVDEGLASGVSDETMDDILRSLNEAAE
ncbi:type II toxin-antitoxin system ParD family antitoxin [Rhizobium sp. NPDC090275]|uniref:type II toxin-antitoxin system ParD family antitoxin n=1 Tax=Rhizobium sp. NPDC090275 TaxID=3364498 RepID=UPI000DDF009C